MPRTPLPVLVGRTRLAVTIPGCSYVWSHMDIHTTTHLCDGDKRLLLVWN